MENNIEKDRQNGIRLIASNTNHIFLYQGFCKIVIDHVKSLLFIEPITEEFKLISAMFKWKFYAQKNILFVFAENDFQDFILIFNTERRCKKVYDLIHREKVNKIVRDEEIYQRILLPIFIEVIRNKNANIIPYRLMLKWMKKLDLQDNEFYVEKMKDDEIYYLMYPNDEEENDGKKNDGTEEKIQRKRKFCEISSNSNSEHHSLNDADLMR